MIKLLLEQYAKTKMINLPKEFSAPKETKLEEINYVLNKVNKENFYELCDIDHRDILEDRLYLFPETKINFIVAIDKMFNPIEKIKHLVDGKVYNMPAFVANGYWRDKVDNKEYMELASKAKVVKFDEADDEYKEAKDNTYAGLKATIGLMIDCIKEEKPEDAKFVYVDNKLGKDKILDLLDKCPKGFLPLYDLGFNVIVEK
jgi:hypothetical protein